MVKESGGSMRPKELKKLDDLFDAIFANISLKISFRTLCGSPSSMRCVHLFHRLFAFILKIYFFSWAARIFYP